ncbi:MAG: hypothetical protein H6737_00865 [Alphaproteobacteria bacterium]|nr:hypothetical protein [Alphaproteobacteria bacterium]
MTEEVDVDPRIEADAERAAQVPPDLWARVEADLDRRGPRDPLVSLPTPVRRLLGGAGLLAFGVGLVGIQGVREDLSGGAWTTFAVCGAMFVLGSLAAAAFSLRDRASRPLPGWPWAPLAWSLMVGGSAVLPWPGMTGVPAAMHAYCFWATSVMVVLSTIWLALLERAEKPVAWRVALAGAGSGLAAFVFQSVFCPGVDLVHLVVGHGGAGVVWSVLAVAVAFGLSLRRR